MKKVIAPQYEFKAVPFNLAGQETIDGAAEQARLDRETAAREAAEKDQTQFSLKEANQ
jgi:hypothetical protein